MDAVQFIARHFYRWPLPTGLVVGILAGWGLSRPNCAFKWRGGQCAWALPGEDVLAGQICWGVVVGVAAAVALLTLRRLRTPEPT